MDLTDKGSKLYCSIAEKSKKSRKEHPNLLPQEENQAKEQERCSKVSCPRHKNKKNSRKDAPKLPALKRKASKKAGKTAATPSAIGVAAVFKIEAVAKWLLVQAQQPLGSSQTKIPA